MFLLKMFSWCSYRLKEVINVAKTLKTPSMTIYLIPETIPYNKTEELKKKEIIE